MQKLPFDSPALTRVSEAELETAERQHYERQVRQRLGREAQIPKRYREASFANLVYRSDSVSFRHAHDFLRGWAANITNQLTLGSGVFLLGGVGVGKTSLAVATMKRAAYCGDVFVRWISTSDLVDTLFRHGEDRERERLRSCPLLVIDDLGKQWISEYSKHIVEDVLCGRYDHGVSTVITSNLRLKELSKTFKEHAWDRIRESYYLLEIEAASWRSLPEGERARLAPKGGE